MSARSTIIVVSIGACVAVAAVAAVIAGGDGSLPAMTKAAAQQNQQSEKHWRAVAPGRVEPPSGIIKVAAPTMGIVSRVLVKVNDTVFAGEPLILLDDDEIESRYAAAEAQAGMRLRLRNEQPAGKSDERRKAEDGVADAETAVFDAQNAVDKAAIAWRTSGASTTNLTSARQALARAESELARRKEQAKTVLANAPLPSPLEAQVASARGDLAFARVNLEKLKIRAPIDGTILQVNINPGELAAPSALQPLLSIANLSTLNVRAELDERDVAAIKIGQAASIRAAAFPKQEFAGTVSSIAPLVQPSRLGSSGPGNRSDVDAVEVLVKLQQPGPLTTGMKVDVYFGEDKPAKDQGKPARESKN